MMTHNNSLNNTQKLIGITGASGFVGRTLVDACIKCGLKVRILTRSQDLWTSNDYLEVVVGDLVTKKNWLDFVQGLDVLIHCAAELKNENLMEEVNVNAPCRLLNASIGYLSHWVQLSSVGAYGLSDNQTINESSLHKPKGLYEITKTKFDKILLEASLKSNLSVSILRPTNIVGLQMKNRSFFSLIKAISSKRFFFIGSREAISTYVHVDDVVEALILCALHPKAKNQVFNLSNDCKLSDIVKTITMSNGFHAKFMCFPDRPLRFLVKIFSNLISLPLTENRINSLTSKVSYPTDKIKKYLGFTPKKSIPDFAVEYLKSIDD